MIGSSPWWGVLDIGDANDAVATHTTVTISFKNRMDIPFSFLRNEAQAGRDCPDALIDRAYRWVSCQPDTPRVEWSVLGQMSHDRLSPAL